MRFIIFFFRNIFLVPKVIAGYRCEKDDGSLLLLFIPIKNKSKQDFLGGGAGVLGVPGNINKAD